MREVAVVGAGQTRFGHLDEGIIDLGEEAVLKAIDDAQIDPKDIQAAYIGNYGITTREQKALVGNIILKRCGIMGIPITRVEGVCASGSIAIGECYKDIKFGLCDIAIAVGVEKMTDVSTPEAMKALVAGADVQTESHLGLTFPAVHAMRARVYMKKYGLTREQLAKIPVKSHRNGALNPYAHFQKEITVEGVLKSPLIADPLRLFDCSPISDGAAAAIITSKDLARKYTDTPVYIVASAQTSGTFRYDQDFTVDEGLINCAKEAYKQAGLKATDIDLAEIHDCFSIAELTRIEDFGFCKKGEGGKFVDEGQTEIDGKIPIGPSGGLKAKGHPVGATGVGQVAEIVKQLRGEAGKRQVKGAEIGLAHCAGGDIQCIPCNHVVHIFKAS